MAVLILHGKEAMQGRMRTISHGFPAFAEACAVAEMEIELEKEIRPRTPFLTGALRASERVEALPRTRNLVGARVFAGGPTAPYAIIVHEDLEAFHDDGEAKYIERPLMESAPFMGARIGRRMWLSSGSRLI